MSFLLSSREAEDDRLLASCHAYAWLGTFQTYLIQDESG